MYFFSFKFGTVRDKLGRPVPNYKIEDLIILNMYFRDTLIHRCKKDTNYDALKYYYVTDTNRDSNILQYVQIVYNLNSKNIVCSFAILLQW